MSKVTKAGEGDLEMMEPHVSTDSVWYVETRKPGATMWRCEGCGLVWTRRHQAEGCEGRGHVPKYEDGPYGVTAMVNGKPVGNIHYFTRYAVRRDKITGEEAKA